MSTNRKCYKCGDADHLTKECKAPRSKWLDSYISWLDKKNAEKKQQNQPPPSSTNPPESAVLDPQVSNAPLPKPRASKRPKLSIDHLTHPEHGMSVVFDHFLDQFSSKYRGKGHEASDLRRLLEMFQHWQRECYPHTDFDDFILRTERIGTTHQLKNTLRTYRDLLHSAAGFGVTEEVMVGERVGKEAGGSGEEAVVAGSAGGEDLPRREVSPPQVASDVEDPFDPFAAVQDAILDDMDDPHALDDDELNHMAELGAELGIDLGAI